MADDSRFVARLDRIGALDRSGAPPAALLAELRGLLRDAGAPAQERQVATEREEVVGRRGTAQAGDIIAM